jgi:hypothetical protein
VKRQFRIIDNMADTGGIPLVLVDDTDTVIRTGDSPRVLADTAFTLGADEVRHDESHMEIETEMIDQRPMFRTNRQERSRFVWNGGFE